MSKDFQKEQKPAKTGQKKANPKKRWKKPELTDLKTDQTAGGPVINPVDGGGRNPS